MKKHALSATVRDVIGRRVKKLRKAGTVPATIYGKAFQSQSLALEGEALLKLLKESGKSSLIQLTVGKDVYPVIIGAVQYQPLTRLPIHVELRKVDLKEKIRTEVPLKLVGEAPAVTNGEGILLQTLQVIEIEALPADLPENLTADLTALKAVGDMLTVSNLMLPAGVSPVTDKDQPIVRVTPPVKEEPEPVTATEATVLPEETQVPETSGEESKTTQTEKTVKA
jgi:large subunit ribosomal protein L25